ncbi:AraC family transcriptional regulator [Rhodococcus erythropolis]|uniref:AraC family transcriptional regulator n=1 Tax=Rhodococcus TaxID=1827 RepID=UPI0004C37DB9|nr:MULTISPECIES: AraC family transcriptional regulator [Rhodococcus]MCJ0945916.1 AraC family transcriptional regulator [Rhodococcus sp. ARC_M8]QEX09255.1 AraC family transcriptional regulator [Rhodococcus erythropolis]ULD44290.1 AraC family transcriptional regulator [Rhodococcus qingshengii]BBE43725.1 AraC family transcriptional regulator [Rhodococcus erythropolis]
MDALSMMLAGSRAEGAFLLRSLLDPPWSLRIEDHAPITVLVLVRGSAVVVSDTGQTEELEAGDVALLRGPDPYTVADHPDTPVHVLIDEAQNCAAVDGTPLEDMSVLGVRTWGNSTSGQTVMLTGTYRLDSYVSRQILDSLTPVAVVRRSIETAPMTNLLEQQIAADGPGQEVLLDRLLDLVLISAARTWFAENPNRSPRWIKAYEDPVIGHALRLIHNRPEHPWTVASLAQESGSSRAAFARRFTSLMGIGPVGYLTEWRLSVAADLLADPARTVSSIAREVGYSSPFALTTAFTRHHGMSPKMYRQTRCAPLLTARG